MRFKLSRKPASQKPQDPFLKGLLDPETIKRKQNKTKPFFKH